MTASKTLISLVATAALAVPATAAAAVGDTSPFDGSPWLAQVSGGAYVDFDLDRAPDHSTVTIDGKRAKVKTVREDGESFYRAFVSKPGLDAQERYKVTIKVTPRRGKAFTFSKRLVLHVARDRRPAGTVGG
jgi:hypothetical protein